MFEAHQLPGHRLARAVEAALHTGLEVLGDVELREFLVSAERLTSWTQAATASAIAEIARRDLLHQERLHDDLFAEGEAPSAGIAFRHRLIADDPHRFLADEVATELSVSRGSAQHKVDFALSLSQYPAVAAGLRTGRLDRPKADAITDLLASVESSIFRETLESAAVDYGATHTKPQLCAWLRKKILTSEPQVAERRRQEAKAQRRVRLYPGSDGMAMLAADLPADTAVAIYRTIDQLAHASCAEEKLMSKATNEANPTDDLDEQERLVPRLTADGRTLEHRRADVFADLLLARTSASRDGGRESEADLQVVVDAATLASSAEAPAELVGYGPITAQHARELAERDGRWRRLLTDSTGELLEVSPKTYRPTAAVERFIKLRDQTCRFPGCRRSPESHWKTPNAAEIDHTDAFPQGLTVPENLALLCKAHHLLKTHSEWSVTQNQAGVLTWVTPSGRAFRTYPTNTQRPSTVQFHALAPRLTTRRPDRGHRHSPQLPWQQSSTPWGTKANPGQS